MSKSCILWVIWKSLLFGIACSSALYWQDLLSIALILHFFLGGGIIQNTIPCWIYIYNHMSHRPVDLILWRFTFKPNFWNTRYIIWAEINEILSANIQSAMDRILFNLMEFNQHKISELFHSTLMWKYLVLYVITVEIVQCTRFLLH